MTRRSLGFDSNSTPDRRVTYVISQFGGVAQLDDATLGSEVRLSEPSSGSEAEVVQPDANHRGPRSIGVDPNPYIQVLGQAGMTVGADRSVLRPPGNAVHDEHTAKGSRTGLCPVDISPSPEADGYTVRRTVVTPICGRFARPASLAQPEAVIGIRFSHPENPRLPARSGPSTTRVFAGTVGRRAGPLGHGEHRSMVAGDGQADRRLLSLRNDPPALLLQCPLDAGRGGRAAYNRLEDRGSRPETNSHQQEGQPDGRRPHIPEGVPGHESVRTIR